jgi:hypothetical protein
MTGFSSVVYRLECCLPLCRRKQWIGCVEDVGAITHANGLLPTNAVPYSNISLREVPARYPCDATCMWWGQNNLSK